MVRWTSALRSASCEALRDVAEAVVRACDAETVSRGVSYLYTKEMRSSFAIEHETPSEHKMARFGAALQSVHYYAALNKQTLVDLQSEDQNFVGETLGRREIVHFISPKPSDVPTMMEGLLEFCRTGQQIDPIVAAAVASFGFVFIHPFDDGNGHIHGYVIHYFLAN